ncbi:MAG: hypothetical protein DRP67_02820 [Candidatus Omnitrophota bacterium]|nr:MAG: hypothetical protein DRP67_02820 [Candidatus Omnitrophota bacterium]
MKFLLFFFIFFSLTIFPDNLLTLPDAIRIAVKNNLGVKIAEEKIKQAYYQKKEAKTYFFPQITSSFNYTHLGKNEGMTIPGTPFPPIKFTEDDIYTFTFSLNQPIFTGGRIKTAYEISKENFENSKIQYALEVQNLIFNVKKAYFSILKAEKFLNTAKKYKELLEKHLKDAKKLFTAGIVTKLDILKTEVAVKQAETGIIEAKNFVKIAKSNLNFILNNPIDKEFEVEDVFEIKEDRKDYEYWRDIALKNRPEIKSMERVLSICEKKIKLEKSNLYPQIYFFTNYNIEKGKQTSFGKWDKNWNTGIFLSFNIWDWGRIKDRIKEAESEKKQIEKQLEIVKKAIELEVKNCYLNLLSAEKKLEKNRKQIEKAEENLRVANLLYKEGMATSTDVIGATTSLIEAKNNYYTSIYEYKIAYSQLEKATGLYTKYEKVGGK